MQMALQSSKMASFHSILLFFLYVTLSSSFIVPRRVCSTDEQVTCLFQSTSTFQVAATTDERQQSLAERCSIPRHALPPPPESTGNPADDGFRSFRDNVPVPIQSWLRDSGVLRFLVDSLVVIGLPSLVRKYPEALSTFLTLSLQCQTVSYGNHIRQKIDVFSPSNNRQSKGLVVICHGGAWGSGEKWMYRLTAAKFLESGYNVAILGYRTFPDATVDGQVSDIRNALMKLKEIFPDNQHTTLIGHSSGAHTSLLGALRQEIQVNALICVAGVYDIVKHYEYEKGRGVNRISPLKPANGHVEDEWKRRSPTRIIRKESMSSTISLPPTLLVHGVEDSVVPYTSALEFHDAIEECSVDGGGLCCTLSILPSIEHAETALDLMVGGKTQDVVVDWLESQMDAVRS